MHKHSVSKLTKPKTSRKDRKKIELHPSSPQRVVMTKSERAAKIAALQDQELPGTLDALGVWMSGMLQGVMDTSHYLQEEWKQKFAVLSHVNQELRDWALIDWQLCEGTILKHLMQASDQHQGLWLNFQFTAFVMAGEEGGPGRFECILCGNSITLKHRYALSPCTECHCQIYKSLQ